jgi:hypothetical protein
MKLDPVSLKVGLQRLILKGAAGWKEIAIENSDYWQRYPYFYESVVIQVERCLGKMTDEYFRSCYVRAAWSLSDDPTEDLIQFCKELIEDSTESIIKKLPTAEQEEDMNLQGHIDYLENLRALISQYDLANRKVERRIEIKETLRLFKVFQSSYGKEVRDRVENPRPSP